MLIYKRGLIIYLETNKLFKALVSLDNEQILILITNNYYLLY